MEERTVLKRRGILAAAAAVVAGIAMKQTSEPVAAGADGDLVMNTSTLAVGTTGIFTDNTFNQINAPFGAFRSNASSTTTVSLDGLVGISSPGAQAKGVHGIATTNGYGVYGEATANGGYGVTGVAGNQFGVIGSSSSGTGVQGQTTTGAYGVYGMSGTGNGVWGEAGTAQGSGGVVGVARSSGAVGFQALAVSPAQYAGFFVGTVSITGSLGVSGSKFAVVKGADNHYRGMYAVESPECWFEDFGEGTLVNGTATIKLDPLFAQHIHTDSYHVFITPHDAEHNLATPTRSAQGFTVAADVALAKLKGKQASDLAGTFSWRVVAKRNDIKGERMPIWEMPTTPLIPDLPKADPLKKA